jgi:hypothetical protein
MKTTPAITKGSTVRIAEPSHSAFGEWVTVLRISRKTAPAVAKVARLHGGELDINLSFLAHVASLIKPALDAMDAAVAERKAAFAAREEEWKQGRRQRFLEEAATQTQQDKGWDAAQPVFEKNTHVSVSDLGGRVTIKGIPYKTTDRKGNEVERQDDYYVDVALRKNGVAAMVGLNVMTREVNWSAIGSVSPALARAYARALLFAADRAELMTLPTAEQVKAIEAHWEAEQATSLGK